MWIAKAWRRQLQAAQVAAMGQITFWSLLAYLVFRLTDMAVRGQFSTAFRGRLGALFLTEIILGGVVPLALLARASERAKPAFLATGAFLATTGVILNRVNVALLAMHLKGPMPQIAPATYYPSVFEWGISIGLIAATIFLFGLGVQLMPVLPTEKASCRGYLKTYNGEGSEAVLLADWSSLHLDIVAQDRGLKRLAASLYEI